MFKIGALENKKKSKIKPSPHPHILPQHPSRVIFSGCSKSGKSNLIITLLKEKRFYKKYYDLIFIFSPSVLIDDVFEHIVPDIVPRTQIFPLLDTAVLAQIVASQKKLVESKGVDKAPRVLILFDDCIDNINMLNNKVFASLYYRGRHLGISVWIATQKLNKIPFSLREQASNLMIFKPSSQKEAKVIYEELANPHTNEDHVKRLLVHATKQPFSFLHVNRQAETKKMFRRNLDKLLSINT